MAENMISTRRKSLQLLVLAAGLLPEAVVARAAAAVGPVVASPHTGLALYGLDPVAYFVDGRPVEGRSDVEHAAGGTVWRFRNAANRAAFIAHPDVYAPRFGGYDPLPLARGVATPGNPLLWLVHENRLYLFHGAHNRSAFAAGPAAILAQCDARWPAVEKTIAP